MKTAPLARLWKRVALFGLIGMAGCIQSFQNVVSDPLSLPAQPAPLRARINLKSWKVTYDGPAGWGTYSTRDDPALLSQVQAEMTRKLTESGAIRIAERPEDADVVIDATVDINGRPSTAALVMTYGNYGLAFLPSLLGAPMTWVTFTTVADFTVTDPKGQTVGHVEDRGDRAHIIGVYYGRKNLSQPFSLELKSMLGALGDFLQQHRAALVPATQTAG